jgi:tRNA threonylcarbamoyladenosine biosynthesis protein TsaE
MAKLKVKSKTLEAMHISRAPKATLKVASYLAHKLLKLGRGKKARVVALFGELGSGKTVFARGFLKALGVRERIISPTFVFVRTYKLPRNQGGFARAYHFDLYRVRSLGDLRQIALKEALRHSQNVVLLEWAERAEKILPKDAIRVRFSHGKNERERVIVMPKTYETFSYF